MRERRNKTKKWARDLDNKQRWLSTQKTYDKLLNLTVCVSCSVVSDSLQPQGLQPARDPPGKNTRNGLPFPSPENLSDPGIKPWSPALQANYLWFELNLISNEIKTTMKHHDLLIRRAKTKNTTHYHVLPRMWYK